MSRSLRPLAGLVTAESLSLLGNQVAAVALPLLVLEFTGSPLTAALAGSANVLPFLLAALWGGRAVDRWGAWNMSVASDALSFCSALLLPLAFIVRGDVPPAAIFLLALAGALFDPTGVAARQTLVPRVSGLAGVPLQRVNSVRGGLENGADFVGPLAAAGLVAMIGAAGAFLVNAGTFLLSAVIFAAAVPRGGERVDAGPVPRWAGIRFVARTPSLRPLVLVGTVGNLVLLPFLGLLLPLLCLRELRSAPLLGLALAAFGLAATAGAASYGWLEKHLSRTALYHAGLVLAGTAIACTSLATQPWQVVVLAGVGGSLLGAGNPLQQTVLQEVAPPEIAGQVFTSMAALQFSAGPPGLMAAGLLVEAAGVDPVIRGAGVLLALAAALGWMALALPERHPPPG